MTVCVLLERDPRDHVKWEEQGAAEGRGPTPARERGKGRRSKLTCPPASPPPTALDVFSQDSIWEEHPETPGNPQDPDRGQALPYVPTICVCTVCTKQSKTTYLEATDCGRASWLLVPCEGLGPTHCALLDLQ